MREILLTAELRAGTVAWTASARRDGQVEYSTDGVTPKTALDTLMHLTQELYERIHALEAVPGDPSPEELSASRPECPRCGGTNTDFDGIEVATAKIFWCRDCEPRPLTWIIEPR
jgi:hypothetical protein